MTLYRIFGYVTIVVASGFYVTYSHRHSLLKFLWPDFLECVLLETPNTHVYKDLTLYAYFLKNDVDFSTL